MPANDDIQRATSCGQQLGLERRFGEPVGFIRLAGPREQPDGHRRLSEVDRANPFGREVFSDVGGADERRPEFLVRA